MFWGITTRQFQGKIPRGSIADHWKFRESRAANDHWRVIYLDWKINLYLSDFIILVVSGSLLNGQSLFSGKCSKTTLSAIQNNIVCCRRCTLSSCSSPWSFLVSESQIYCPMHAHLFKNLPQNIWVLFYGHREIWN